MKKYSVMLLVAVMMLLSACGKSTVPNDATSDAPATVEYSYVDDLVTLDDVARYSSNIVKAKLVSVEDFNGAVCVYQFGVTEDYTQNTPDAIHMYDAYNGAYIVGDEYYLFLSSGESALYPHTIYTTVVKDLIINANDTVIATSIVGKERVVKKEEVTSIIKNSIAKGVIGEKADTALLVTDTSNLLEVNETADIVAEVRISAETNANIYVSTYAVEVVSVRKGSEELVPSVMNLPPNLDQNKTYLVFLKEAPSEDGTYSLFSRSYPIMDTASTSAKALLTE